MESDGVTESDMYKNFYKLLTDKAREWYWNEIPIREPRNWRDMKAMFMAKYKGYESKWDILTRMSELTQKENQLFDDFFQEMMGLYNQLDDPPSEHELIENIQRNLNDQLFQATEGRTFMSLQTFREACSKAEGRRRRRSETRATTTYPRSQTTTSSKQSSYPKKISELGQVETENSGVDECIDELRKTRDLSKIKCFNCNKNGHSFMYCKSPINGPFCWKCGTQGNWPDKCMTCQSGNTEANGKSRDTRSTNTIPGH